MFAIFPPSRNAVIGPLAATLILLSLAQARASVLTYDRGKTQFFGGVSLYDDDGKFVRHLSIPAGDDRWFSLTNGPGTDVLLVGDRRIERYDGLTGEDKGLFARNPAPAYGDMGAAFDPRRGLFALRIQGEDFEHRYDLSQRYDASGAYLGTVGTSDYWFRSEPHDVKFGPDGDLYVGTVDSKVFRYDGETFAYKGVFAQNTFRGEYEMGRLSELAFGPGGDLFASDPVGHQVLRFDGRTGAPKGVFAAPVRYAYDLVFGPGSDLLVRSDTKLLRFDGQTGAAKGVFADVGEGFDVVYVPGEAVPLPVPEPTTALVIVAGLAGLAGRARWVRAARRVPN
jgi:hypothetical protein